MRLFTMGAHIEPVEVTTGEWVWMVTEFKDDTFDDGGELFNPIQCSDTESGLTKDRIAENS